MVTFDAGNVLQNWIDITTVDLREFSEMRVFACKYCHGKDHQYMWLSQREFDSKHSQARAGKGPWRQIDRRQQRFQDVTNSSDPMATDAGGFGFTKQLIPRALPRVRRVWRNDGDLPRQRWLQRTGCKSVQRGVTNQRWDPSTGREQS